MSEPAFELAQVVPEGRESLAFAIEKPRDWQDHLGVYSTLAHLYELRVSRLLAAGDHDGAMRAYERARHWLVLYASGATSGGEGAANSRERDQRLATLRGALGLDA